MIPVRPALTLKYNGTEKLLAAWGFSDGCSLLLTNQETDVFSFTAEAARLSAAPFIPYGGQVEIYARTLTAPEVFTAAGGQLLFSGERVLQRDRTTAAAVNRRYDFAGPWHDLDLRPYLQYRAVQSTGVTAAVQAGGDVVVKLGGDIGAGVGAKVHLWNTGDLSGVYTVTAVAVVDGLPQITFAGVLGAVASLTSAGCSRCDLTSDLILGFDLWQTGYTGGVSNQFITAGRQIRNILDFAIAGQIAEFGAARFAIGAIDAALMTQPIQTYPCKDIKCAEAISMVLRIAPNAAVWFDYSVSPPAINVTVARPALGLPYCDGDIHRSSELTPRYDLQLDAVLLLFKQVNDGRTGIFRTIWPDDGSKTGLERGTLVQTIDLAGISLAKDEAQLVVEAADFYNGPGATLADNTVRRSWWAKHHAAFNDGTPEADYTDAVKLKNVKFNMDSLKVVTEDGDDITATWFAATPRVITEGSPTGWMAGVNAQRAIISIEYSSTENDAGGFPAKKPSAKMLSQEVWLTDAPVGDNTYTMTSLTGFAEPIPGATGVFHTLNGTSYLICNNGLAEFIFKQMAALQHEGTHSLIQRMGPGGVAGDHWDHLIGIQHKLYFTGPKAPVTINSADAAAGVHQLRINFSSGMAETEAGIGVAKHLSAGDLTQLFLINRFRQNFGQLASFINLGN